VLPGGVTMRLLPLDYAIRNLGRSPLRLAGMFGGNALVVLLAIAAASFVEGMRASLSPPADGRNVILLGVGSEESLERSEIPASTPSLVAASVPGIRVENGVAFVSPEVNAALMLETETGDHRAVVRGVTPTAFLVHPQVEIVEGRAPVDGRNEALVGEMASAKTGLEEEDLAVARTLRIEGVDWTIVGRFRAPKTAMAAEIWLPLTDLKIAAKRETISAVIVAPDAAEFADFDAFAKIRTDLELAAIAESEYQASLLRFYRPVRAMVWATALLVGLAGLLGGLNTMFAAFAARAREIGMLQSLGYTRGAIVVGLVQESVLVAAAAVLAASAIAWLTIDGMAVRFSMGVFELRMTGAVVLAGTLAGAVLGLVGALPPAMRCLKMPIAQALKSA